jgi:hypothetical protein
MITIRFVVNDRPMITWILTQLAKRDLLADLIELAEKIQREEDCGGL